MSEKVSVYFLETHAPKQGKKQYRVDHEISLGSAKSNDISFSELDLAPKHCVFRTHQGVLTVFQVAESGSTKIGRQSLENGRMYILEKSDKLTLGDLKIVIKVEKVAPEDIQDEEDEENDLNLESPVDDQAQEDEEFEEEEESSPSLVQKLLSRFKKKTDTDDEDFLEEEAEEEIEEEVQEEDGGDKTDEIKNSIYIPKSKINEEAAPAPANHSVKKQRKTYINREHLPAFFSRFYAFIFEVIVSFGFIANIVPIFELEQTIDQIYLDIFPLIEPIKNLLPTYLGEHAVLLDPIFSAPIITVVFTWFTFNLLSNLALGANLGLALMGVSTEGSFVIARAKGVIRFLIGIVTLPLLLPDLPILIKKRSLKEVLTGSELRHGHFLIRTFGIFVVIPAITIAFVLASALLEPAILEGPQVTKNLTVKAPTPEIAMQTHPWRELQIALNYPQDIDNEWVISPRLQMRQGKIVGSVSFLRRREEAIDITTFGPITKLNLPINLIKSLLKRDPFFANKYPEAAKEVANEKFSSYSDESITSLFLDVLNMNWDSIPRFISERGPIITPYIELKKYLISTFGITDSLSSNLLGRRTIISIPSGTNRLKMVTVSNGRIIQVELRSTSGGIAALTKFQRTFLTHAAPLMSGAVASPNETESWTFLDWLDHFNLNNVYNLTTGIVGLKAFTAKSLENKQLHPWAAETIEADYSKTMQTLNKLTQDDPESWAKDIFDAMNTPDIDWQKDQFSSDDNQAEEAQE